MAVSWLDAYSRIVVSKLFQSFFKEIRTVKNSMRLCETRRGVLSGVRVVLVAGGIMMMSASVVQAQSSGAGFGPGNPFDAPSALPFQAPPFDKIKDGDYQPAIEAGMAEQMKEIRAIADNPAGQIGRASCRERV